MWPVLERILYAGLIGGLAAGTIGALLWGIEKARGKPLIEAPREPMSREDMIARLRAMSEDSTTSAAERQKAATRLRALGADDHGQ